MKPIRSGILLALLALALLSVQLAGTTFAKVPIVQAVLFYSPTCGHCHYVITEVLPPLFEQYGDQLQIMGVSIANPDGQTLYQAAIEHFGIPAERRGVPTLILGETVLVGSLEIPEQLPGLIEQSLAEGGVDWPDFPGLAAVLPETAPSADTAPGSIPEQATAAAPVVVPGSVSEPVADTIAPQNDLLAPDEPTPDDLMSRFRRDPIGNTIAILLLAGMLVVVGNVLRRMRWIWTKETRGTPGANSLKGWRAWAVALLSLVGLGVSIYMAYVETTATPAVCGPIGDCNTVQQSPYAVLLGLIPIGVLGVLGYAGMLSAWAGTQWGRMRFRKLSESALFGMALLGTLFSIYLTFLEPFVIGATCAWCMTSAVSMTLILLVLAGSLLIHTEPAR